MVFASVSFQTRAQPSSHPAQRGQNPLALAQQLLHMDSYIT